MRIHTSAEIREIDRHAAEKLFIPTALLMENAGRAVAEVVREEAFGKRAHCVVVCGKGNNGGDGYVAARHLRASGMSVSIVSKIPIEALHGDALQNARAADACAIPRNATLREVVRNGSALVIVDAVLGTGLTRAPEGWAKELIDEMNHAREAGARIVSVDVPSGVDADRPHPPGAVVRATVTVALHALKPAHVQYPARGLCGEVRLAPIGLPAIHDYHASTPARRWLDWLTIGTLPTRDPDSHKGTAGHVLVVAGSPGKSGASYMSCAAALRSGAGLVTLASAPEVIDRVLPQLPEAMGHPLRSIMTEGLREALERKNALVIGPGIARDDQTGRVIVEVLKNLDVPAIIDADGLNALAQSRDALQELAKARLRPVLTPHPAELARLLQCTTEDVQRDRLASASEAASRFNAHVVLKGACSVIAHPEGSLAVNSTGNAAMATAGMGDVLSGVVGALLGQRLDAARAAEVATYAHGRAGDLAVKGDRGLVATDLIAQLPPAFAELTPSWPPTR